jgi:uncharacterized protein (DUF1330 family)
MAAYLIVDLKIKDPAAWEAYKSAVSAVIHKHGGEYLIRGGALQVLEGDWQPNRVVVLRFPDGQALDAFWTDPEYLPLKELRHRVAHSNIVRVEGV